MLFLVYIWKSLIKVSLIFLDLQLQDVSQYCPTYSLCLVFLWIALLPLLNESFLWLSVRKSYQLGRWLPSINWNSCSSIKSCLPRTHWWSPGSEYWTSCTTYLYWWSIATKFSSVSNRWPRPITVVDITERQVPKFCSLKETLIEGAPRKNCDNKFSPYTCVPASIRCMVLHTIWRG